MQAPTHTVTYVGTTTQQTFPAGTVVGPIQATLTGIAPVNLDANLTAVFTNVPDGTYTLTVQAYDATMNPLGAPYTVSVTVSDPGVVVNVPNGGTVTVS